MPTPASVHPHLLVYISNNRVEAVRDPGGLNVANRPQEAKRVHIHIDEARLRKYRGVEIGVVAAVVVVVYSMQLATRVEQSLNLLQIHENTTLLWIWVKMWDPASDALAPLVINGNLCIVVI
jgi:hypothetical protein